MIQPYWTSSDGRHAVYCGDCKDIIPSLGLFDLCMTDPPYGISANRQTLGSGKKVFERGGDWDEVRPDVSGLVDIAKYVCIWGGNYFADLLPPNNHWLIWHKKNDNLSFSECEMAWTNFGKQIRHISHHWSGEIKVHPTQKPLRIAKWCLSQCPECETVVDPYMGAGTFGVACEDYGKKFTGIDMDSHYCKIAVRRIEEAMQTLWRKDEPKDVQLDLLT